MKQVIDGLTRFDKNPSSFAVTNYDPLVKKQILDYMKSFEVNSVGGLIDDCRTGELIYISNSGYEDEVYSWTMQDIYHIEKYNAAVNPEFIIHVKKKTERPK